MNLKTLSRRCAQIALTVLGRQIINKPQKIRGHFTSGLLQTQHELKILLSALTLNFTVRLHVRAVILENLHGILRDTQIFCFQLLEKIKSNSQILYRKVVDVSFLHLKDIERQTLQIQNEKETSDIIDRSELSPDDII